MEKLLVSCGTLSSGGAERVLSVLSCSFADAFQEVTYITWIDMPDFYQLDPRVKRICIEKECGSKSIFKKALWFRRYVKMEKISLVLSFLEPFNIMICAILFGIKVPIIVSDRNDPRVVWNSFCKKNIRKTAYSKASGIVCQTEHNKCYYKGSLLRKAKVIMNPVFMPDDYVGKALRANKENRIVAVVRLDIQKNLQMLIKAFDLFHSQHPEYSLTIYGEGPNRAELEKLVESLGLGDSVCMPGRSNHVWDDILVAKCFALSSNNEGLPNALIEAMCLGLPCVSTKVSGAVDLIKSGDNGFLVDKNDFIGMASCFESIIADDNTSNTMGEKATLVYGNLRTNVISRQWVAYLKSFI